MSSGSSRVDWQHGGPPPPSHRGNYSPYDSPSPYEGHPPPAPHDNRSPPYGSSFHGYGRGHSQGAHAPHLMPPARGDGGGPPHSHAPHHPSYDYWSYDQSPPPPPYPGAPRRPAPPGWHPAGLGPARSTPHALDSPGAPYDHRMGPPPPPQQQQHQHHGYPYPAPQRHYSPHPPSMGDGRPRPYMPDVQPPPPPGAHSMRGPPPVAHTPPRSGTKAAYGTPIRSSMASPNVSTPPAAKKTPHADDEKESPNDAKQKVETKSKTAKGKGAKGKGDPLSLLAKVCKQESEDDPPLEAPATPAPVPTSPAHRRLRPSPVVTPASTPLGKPPLMPHPHISPVDHRAEGGYWATEAGPERFSRRTMPRESEGVGGRGGPYPPLPQQQHGSRPAPPYGNGPPLNAQGPYSEWQMESPTPNLVERGSFDSSDTREHAYDSRRGAPSIYYGGGGSGEYPPPARPPPPSHSSQRPYPPPRWSTYPSDPSIRPGIYPSPSHEMGHPPFPMDQHSHYPHPSQVTPAPYPPEGPAHRHYPPPHSMRPTPGSHQQSRGPNTPLRRLDGGPPPPMTYAPYTYVQQPHLEEKTILRKKFSWKHYPELERFLIGNRDDYLKHSNMNYTAEQKQYNNWLTERLLEVAAEHHYAFDPEEFNFVAIRDRIRCYYKSYVQTARKRGLNLPTKAEPVVKKARTGSNAEDEEEKDETAKDSMSEKMSAKVNAGDEELGDKPTEGDDSKKDTNKKRKSSK